MTMELEFDRDILKCYETVLETTLCQEETLESIVPDACPDILRILDVCGQATLSGKQAKNGSAVVSGMVRASILYQPEDGAGLRCMEIGLPFTCQAEATGLTDGGIVFASPRLRSAEARALNPRKVLLRVDLAIDLLACQPRNQVLCTDVLDREEHAICQQCYTGDTYPMVSVEEKSFTFADKIRVQGGTTDPVQLLSLRAVPVCAESKLIGTKLIFKGSVEVQMLLQESGGTLFTNRESMPFSQVMEVSGAGETGDCRVQVELTDFRCEPEQDEARGFEITLELLAQARVWSRRPLTALQDLYSTHWQTEVEQEEQQFWGMGEQSVRPQGVREFLETQDVVRSVVDSRMVLGQITQRREGDQLLLTGEAWVCILYLNEHEQLQVVRKTIPVSCRLEHSGDSLCSCRCLCQGELFAAPAAGGVEVRFTLEFHCMLTNRLRVPVVTAARLTERRGAKEGVQPSVVLRMAMPGESLWALAKAYGTTGEQIIRANELEDDHLPEGKMLLIPGVRG